MKKYNRLWISLSLSLLVSCDLTTKSYLKPGSLPELTTTEITAISQYSAISGGIITSNGLNRLLVCGVCWSTNSNPTFDDNKTTQYSETGTYTSYITGLTGSTTYFVRAYATTFDGTSYGDACQFKTQEATPTITDVDGNVYHTVQIGTQLWMAENLKTTKYNDGTSIPFIDSTSILFSDIIRKNKIWNSLTTPAFCWYENDTVTNKKTYGALYNWYAVNTGRLAPIGWHVPTDDEWRILSNYLGGDAVSGGKMKSTTSWNSPNTGATNSSGFSGLPGGWRQPSYGFGYEGSIGSWWSATECSSNLARSRYLRDVDSFLVRDYDLSNSQSLKKSGLSVRCVKD